MNKENDVDVFISHSVDEKAAAQKIKSLLLNTFGKGLKVFISSDRESIPGGDNWFEKIVSALRSSKVVLVMLSNASTNRPWINFEAGLGYGAGIRVIPVVFRGMKKGDVKPPLSCLQVRETYSIPDLDGLLNDVQVEVKLQKNKVSLDVFLDELIEIEKDLPKYGVHMVPTLKYSGKYIELDFKLENLGNNNIEPIEVWATVPDETVDRGCYMREGPPAVKVEYDSTSIPQTITKKQFPSLNAEGAHYRTDFNILPAELAMSMFPYKLTEMRFMLKNNAGGNSLISYGIHVKQGEGDHFSVKLEEIDGYRKS